jgi:hypothetical protein
LPWIGAIIWLGVILADWATAVAAIGGALIGAAAGVVAGYLTFKGALIGTRSQEREAWRSRQIEAAQTFIAEYTTAVETIAKSVWGGGDLGSALTTGTSEAVADVRSLIDADATTREVLEWTLQEKLRSGNEASSSFLQLVHVAIRPEEP